MGALVAALLFAAPPEPLVLDLSSTQAEELPEARCIHSYAGAVRWRLRLFTVSLLLFGGIGDPLSQDPLRHEDFLGPELAFLFSPRWMLRAQLAKALRAGSGDVATVAASWIF